MDRGFVAWFVKDKAENMTRGGLSDRYIGIKIFSPQSQGSSMGSGFDKSKKIVMAIFGVQVEVVAREEVIQGKSNIIHNISILRQVIQLFCSIQCESSLFSTVYQNIINTWECYVSLFSCRDHGVH